jgi:ABC-type uncharacterized transport system permease subunit
MSELMRQVETQYGLLVLVLFLLLGVSWFLLWKTTWSVWKKAMEAKDEEIRRISVERDKYQALVFAHLKSSGTEVRRGDGRSSG